MNYPRLMSRIIVVVSVIALVSISLISAVPTARAENILQNGDFNNGQSNPWVSLFLDPAKGSAAVVNGELCLTIETAGNNAWEVQTRQSVQLTNGRTYTISFKARATAATTVYAKIGNSGEPYAEYWNQTVNLTTEPQTFTASFTMNGNDTVANEFAFHMGGPRATATTPFTICFDDIVLDDPQFTPEPSTPTTPMPNVRVNQVGYLPMAVKQATVVNAATTALPWQLYSGSGRIVASGMTTVFGQDPDSGDHVHIVDFSAYQRPGMSFMLKVGDDMSHPFDISSDIYSQMKYDALAYFYHNRSGIAIEMPYAGGEQWTRPAGHVGVPPNKGDTAVPCAPDTGCSYSLDVTGGWYDAGDHGKYVVNGGISVWTLMNQYEHAKYYRSSTTMYGDGTLSIPEMRNGIPDILDEARWELDFMLKMQVPEGQPRAGMVHHKVHDVTWTGLPLRPDQDPRERYLRPPSTAATLNLAATAAQCSRIWEDFDRNYSRMCLRAAERAWKAALANPAVYAPAEDNTGGGPYNDNNVTDEFYWAAAELYATTHEAEYRKFVQESPLYLQVPTTFGENTEPGMTWGSTQALGTITLATVRDNGHKREGDAARQSIVNAANTFVGLINEQGYRLPFAPPADGRYPWGSNSFVLNNMVIMALAYDFTNDAKYFNGVVDGMGYILGRNAMDKAYVSGYGERPLENPHHRFWAHQIDPSYPSAPGGAVSGGPNSSLQDPYAQGIGLSGCAPQKCYVDHIESWSTNEITINWNAPFAWLTAFLDEQAHRMVRSANN